MFGRRRHAAVQQARAADASAPAAALDDEAAFALLRSRLDELFGPGGTWIAQRRQPGDDTLFDAPFVDYLAGTLTATLWPRERHPHPHAAAVAAELDATAAAIGWEPDPLTVIADLRHPVTGRIAVAAAAAEAATRAHASAEKAGVA